MNWPPKWICAVLAAEVTAYERAVFPLPSAEKILDRLHEIGALKELPGSQERWECRICGETWKINPKDAPPQANMACGDGWKDRYHQFIHFKEVIES